MKYVIVLMLGLVASVSLAEPDLYFTDASGNRITSMTAAAGDYVTLYIYGQTDTGNTYDYFNLGVAYNPAAITPKTGVAASDLVMSTSTTFGGAFGIQETTYEGTSLLNAAASSMTGAPAGFGPTLLATAYFTFSGTPTSVSFFNEADEYTYSTFFMDTNAGTELRFSDLIAINAVPEPMTISLISVGLLSLIARRRKA